MPTLPRAYPPPRQTQFGAPTLPRAYPPPRQTQFGVQRAPNPTPEGENSWHRPYHPPTANSQQPTAN